MASSNSNHAIHLDAMMEIRHSRLIAKSARRGATNGDITTVRFKSDGRDERREGGPASWDRGLSYVHNRGHPTNLHQIGWLALFAGNFLIKIDVLPFLT